MTTSETLPQKSQSDCFYWEEMLQIGLKVRKHHFGSRET